MPKRTAAPAAKEKTAKSHIIHFRLTPEQAAAMDARLAKLSIPDVASSHQLARKFTLDVLRSRLVYKDKKHENGDFANPDLS